jgi:hypothetical protein
MPKVDMDGEQEVIRHVAATKEVRFLGSLPSDLEQEFLAHVRAKRWSDVRCDAVFTDKAVYVVPAIRDRRDLAALGYLLGAGTVVGLFLANRMKQSAERKAVRRIDMNEALRIGSRYGVPYWPIADSRLQVFEQRDWWDPFGAGWSTHLNIAGPCHYQGKSFDAAVEIRLPGRVTKKYLLEERPPDYDPIAALFGYRESEIKRREARG